MLAVDTSVAVPLLLRAHAAHAEVVGWWAGREIALSGHAAVETYAVLTRLPSDARLAPDDAVELLHQRFAATLLPESETNRRLPEICAARGIAGGAVHDAIVALAAIENNAVLATRDARARGTYEKIGVSVELALAH